MQLATEINEEEDRSLTKSCEWKYIGKDTMSILRSDIIDDLFEIEKRKFNETKALL